MVMKINIYPNAITRNAIRKCREITSYLRALKVIPKKTGYNAVMYEKVFVFFNACIENFYFVPVIVMLKFVDFHAHRTRVFNNGNVYVAEIVHDYF